MPRERFTITPRAYRRVAYAALAALALIVLTGAGVRLTGSGLGCPHWPKCGDGVVAPLETHAMIEYGNRLFSALVGLISIAAGVLAWRRRPFRRDLAVLGVLLPVGVVAQGVLGGLTVIFGLKPGFVMSHFLLSMLILVFAVALAWRATYEPGERPRSTDRLTTWTVRALVPVGAVVIFAGTVATAAGPHAGSSGTGEIVDRFFFKGVETLDWTIHNHARLAIALGLIAVAAWILLWRRSGDRQALLAVSALLAVMVLQGVVGTLQYKILNLPTELVWLHVLLASAAWISILWAAAAAGRLAPRARPAPSEPPRSGDAERPPEPVSVR